MFSNKFYLIALAILLPTSINLSITQFLTPILNAFMVRSINPELSISVFSIAMSILFFNFSSSIKSSTFDNSLF